MQILDQIFVHIKGWMLTLAGKFLPEWTVILLSIFISAVAIVALGVLSMMYLTLLERKVVGRIQNRIGPNRAGKWGLLQPIADGIKMFTKEDIVPAKADPILHFLAPVLIVVPAFLLFTVLPFGRGMIAANLNIGVLFFVALSSTTTIAVFMASWGSRNKFSLFGGMRSVAQMISYEVPMVLAAIPVILMSSSLSTVTIVHAQSEWAGLKWFVFTPWGFLAFIIFFLCSVAEVNRCPFDFPEGESELVAGFHTEYSGMKFAFFYMAEFMNMFAISALTATLFLGGWNGPFLPSWIWFFGKTIALIGIMVWFRGTLPRFRIDQMMGLAWKLLLPLTFVNIFVVGFWYFANRPFRIAGSIIILLLAFWVIQKWNQRYLPEKRNYVLAE